MNPVCVPGSSSSPQSYHLSRFLIVICACCFLLLVACSPSTETSQPTNDLVSTLVAGTVSSQLTQIAQASTPTPPPTPTPFPTPPPTFTLTPTPQPTMTLTPTPLPVLCNQAQLISDLTIPDGLLVPPNAQLLKIWRLKNAGSCTWTPEYSLVFSGGDQLNGPDALSLPRYVGPGETIDLPLWLSSPSKEGSYQSGWMLRNASQILFGVGSDGNAPFYANITVVGIDKDYAYDFVGNTCQASWESASGILPCLGLDLDNRGFINVQYYPKMETGQENKPAFWLHPNFSNNGWITGTFPPVLVKNGYHFKSDLSCLASSIDCDIIFSLDYQITGKAPQNIGGWREVNDGTGTPLDIDLSWLAGEPVQFTFRVNVNHQYPDQSDALWLAPRLIYIQPTVTPTPPQNTF